MMRRNRNPRLNPWPLTPDPWKLPEDSVPPSCEELRSWVWTCAGGQGSGGSDYSAGKVNMDQSLDRLDLISHICDK